MGWKQEAREVTQNSYGAYCNICRELKIEPAAYYNFTFELFDEVKKIRKERKRLGEQK